MKQVSPGFGLHEQGSKRPHREAPEPKKPSFRILCMTGALLLPFAALDTATAQVVEDLSDQAKSFYEQTEVRQGSSGSLVLFNQVQEHQREIQRLRGEIEELRYQFEQSKRLSQQRYLELEKRLNAVGSTTRGEPSSRPQVDQDSANQVTEIAGGSNEEAAKSAYRDAFDKVQARDFPAATGAFESFVAQYPDSSLAANGYYWLGELYSSDGELDKAATAFQRVIDDFSESSKAPDAMYKLGLLRARQGQPEDSRRLLEQVQKEHPQSSAANLAKQFLNQSVN